MTTNYDRIADSYDRWVNISNEETEATISALAALAGSGPVLELGVGTGRIALPLVARGLVVHGIERSLSMTKQLRAKPGGAEITVLIGDFADVPVHEQYSLIYVVFNTFFELQTTREQLCCLERGASHLQRDGVFVIEAFGPNLDQLKSEPTLNVRSVTADEVRLEITLHDDTNQHLTSQHIVIREDQVRMFNVQLRYSLPSELDSMAHIAGMSLRERWNDWSRSPVTSRSRRHISLYELQK